MTFFERDAAYVQPLRILSDFVCQGLPQRFAGGKGAGAVGLWGCGETAFGPPRERFRLDETSIQQSGRRYRQLSKCLFTYGYRKGNFTFERASVTLC